MSRTRALTSGRGTAPAGDSLEVAEIGFLARAGVGSRNVQA